MKRNIAYKADGTEETGKAIIDALLAAGGKNIYCYIAMTKDAYFFIDHNGQITNHDYMPFCYDLKSLDEQQNISNAIENIRNETMDLLSRL